MQRFKEHAHMRRERLYLKKDSICMCGKSLGLASGDAEQCISNDIEKWKTHEVQIWTVDRHKNYQYTNRFGRIMAELVGADIDGVTMIGSSTVNIHQTNATSNKPTEKSLKILVGDTNFPTDGYAIDRQKDAVEIVNVRGRYDLEDLISAMTEEAALEH